MGHRIKGQKPGTYRPSIGRKNAGGLKTVRENNNPNAMRRWNVLRQAVKRGTSGVKGRFTVGRLSPPKNNFKVTQWNREPPGLYFLSINSPYRRGRFNISNVRYLPFPNL